MVIKPKNAGKAVSRRFECGVNLNGNQTVDVVDIRLSVFECGVNLNGNQTTNSPITLPHWFECGVNLNGNQTHLRALSE